LNNGAPIEYNYANMYNATLTPSTIHVQDSALTSFFRKYLLQKAISIFKWELPETWAKDYFLYTLFCYGYLAVFNTNKYGVIPQQCGLRGFDIFYRPTHAVISNPLLTGILEPKIDAQCTIIKLQPNYSSIMDLVNYYAGMMALSSETATTNLINSKLAYVGFVDNKQEAESFKKAFDMIASGEPMVVIDKRGKSQQDAKNWDLFTQNIGQNYIVSDILSDMKKWTQMFLTEIGIGNANTDKKERLITAEVEANNEETITMAELWLEQLQDACKKTRDMFGIQISVDWRIGPGKDGTMIEGEDLENE
jgi:hypothetical protein